jgi:WS/DGAT/MGAT family acyltransferase
VKLAMMLLDLERDPPPDTSPLPPEPLPERPGVLERVLDAAEHERRRSLGIAQRALTNVARLARDPLGTSAQAAADLASVGRLVAPAFEPLSPLLRERSIRCRFDTLTVGLPELKAAARRVDGRMNDAFVAAVAGGLRRYHEEHGRPVEELRMTMPINVRTEETEAVAGNQFSPARFVVPVGIADPCERMRAVRALIEVQRNEPSHGFTEGLAGVLNRLPTTLVTSLFGRMLKGIDFLTSNVPGAPIPVFLAGARLEAQYAFGPLGGAAVNTTLLSYVDECNVGVNTDPAAVPDPDVFLACLEEGFAEVRKLA